MYISELHFQTNASISDTRHHFAKEYSQRLHCAQTAVALRKRHAEKTEKEVSQHNAITRLLLPDAQHHIKDRKSKPNSHKGFTRFPATRQVAVAADNSALRHRV